MSGDKHDKVMQTLAEALARPAAERGNYLDAVCADDSRLRREVEQLLRFEQNAGEVFTAAALPPDLEHPRPGADPTQIGPYKILERIGAGGMGVVYKAERRSPMRQLVAIKIIKLGYDTREVIARFESERQALARMDHPHVARVLDAGTTDSGRPYFVMEYVAGVPITRFADHNKLTIEDRLLLFTQVCQAIAHAHTKAIIHRDIKATNVLAYLHDGKPTVKVIDFGIAKALTGDRLTERTFNTDRGHVVGTWETMSPEQSEGSPDIDTRTDVYSLGVLLYELLTGAMPFDRATLARAADEEIRRIIREVEPPRPSTRLSSLGAEATKIAAARRVKLDALAGTLKSELEWIPLKAMRKERDRRYASPLQLAEDVHNYLQKRPLLAGPESRAYRVSKFLRRHRAGVAACAAMLLLLLGGILTTSWQAIRATRAEANALEQQKQAQEERDNAQATLDFLTRDVLAGATPENIPDAKVRDQIVSAMITPAAERVGETFKDRPLIEASIRDAIHKVLWKIGRADMALPHTERALALRTQVLGADHPDTITSLNNYAFVMNLQGRSIEAELLYKQVLESSRRALGADHPDSIVSLNNYAFVLQSLGRAAEAEPLLKEALELNRRAFGEGHRNTIMSLNNYAHVLNSLSRLEEAEPLYKRALEQSRRSLGEDDPGTITSLHNYASVLQSQGRSAEAEAICIEAIERRRKVLGEAHPDTLASLNNYAVVLHSLGRAADAEPLFNKVLEERRRLLGDDHPDTTVSLGNYAFVLQSLGRFQEAEPLVREAMERSRRRLGVDHPDALKSLNNYAFILEALGRSADAEPLYKEALERRERVLGQDHPDTITSLNNYAVVLQSLGRLAEAEPLFLEGLERSRRVLGENHPDTIGSLNNFAGVLRSLGRAADAEPLFREALERSHRVLGEDHPDTIQSMNNHARTLAVLARAVEAEPLARQAVAKAIANPSLGPNHPGTANYANTHAKCLDALGRHDEAATLRRRFGLGDATTRPSTAPATPP